MKWVSQLYSKFEGNYKAPPGSSVGHIGGIFERVMGFAIGNEQLMCRRLPVLHNQEYKSKVY